MKNLNRMTEAQAEQEIRKRKGLLEKDLAVLERKYRRKVFELDVWMEREENKLRKAFKESIK